MKMSRNSILLPYTHLNLALHVHRVDGGWSIAIWRCLASSVCRTTYAPHRQLLNDPHCICKYDTMIVSIKHCLNLAAIINSHFVAHQIFHSRSVCLQTKLQSLLNVKYVKIEKKNSSNIQR